MFIPECLLSGLYWGLVEKAGLGDHFLLLVSAQLKQTLPSLEIKKVIFTVKRVEF